MGKGIRIRNSLGMCLWSSRYKMPPGPSCTVPIFDGRSHRAVDPIHDMLQNVRENSAWICRPYQLLNFHDSGPSLETPGLSKCIKQCPLPSSGDPLATTFVDENF